MLRKENQNPSLSTEVPFLALHSTALGKKKVLSCPKSLLPGHIVDNSVIFSPGHRGGKITEERHWVVWTNPNSYGTVEVYLTSKGRFAIELWPM